MSAGKPTRATLAGTRFLELRAKARRERRPTDELLQLYALEGFLERLAHFPQASHWVLKGGVLLAAYDVRRPTRDIDLQGRRIPGAASAVLEQIRAIASREASDGLSFDAEAAEAETIRDGDEDDYTGTRVTLRCRLASAKIAFHVDVSVGDPIWPAPKNVKVPRLLGGGLTLLGYPLAMVHAEKVVTAVQRGTANTRWRDFADLYLLSGRHAMEGGELRRALTEVAKFRRATLVPLSKGLQGFAAIGAAGWRVWRRKQRLEERLPASFDEVLAADVAFADPALEDQVERKTWSATARTWRSAG